MRVRLNLREWRSVPIVAGLKTIVFAPGELVEIQQDDEKYIAPFIATGLLVVAEDDLPQPPAHPRLFAGLTADKIVSVQPMDGPAPASKIFTVDYVEAHAEPVDDSPSGLVTGDVPASDLKVEDAVPPVVDSSDGAGGADNEAPAGASDAPSAEESAPKSIPRKKAK